MHLRDTISRGGAILVDRLRASVAMHRGYQDVAVIASRTETSVCSAEGPAQIEGAALPCLFWPERKMATRVLVDPGLLR